MNKTKRKNSRLCSSECEKVGGYESQVGGGTMVCMREGSGGTRLGLRDERDRRVVVLKIGRQRGIHVCAWVRD